jgi:predicted phage terminase large subunit-like protein
MFEDLTPAEYDTVLRQDFATFAARCFHELNPQAELAMNRHLEVIAAKLAALRQGKIRRLIINLPPRHLKSLGEYNFAGQHQQSPAPLGGGLVKADWFKRYPDTEKPERFDRIVQSWDTANKASELSDYSVCTTWGIAGKQLYQLGLFRRRLEYPALKRAVREQQSLYNAHVVLIEDKASGTQLIQELIVDGCHAVTRYQPTLDKTMRLHAQTAMIENGFVHLPQTAPWLAEYLHEMTTFPKGKMTTRSTPLPNSSLVQEAIPGLGNIRVYPANGRGTRTAPQVACPNPVGHRLDGMARPAKQVEWTGEAIKLISEGPPLRPARCRCGPIEVFTTKRDAAGPFRLANLVSAGRDRGTWHREARIGHAHRTTEPSRQRAMVRIHPSQPTLSIS